VAFSGDEGCEGVSVKVARDGKRFSRTELEELCTILLDLACGSRRLLAALNGRVLVEWLDPLGSSGRAIRYYEKLRSALDEEWSRTMQDSHPSPFYGSQWGAELNKIDISPKRPREF
jgi:hypothetical protein